jgi:hypothetical protein
VHVERLRRSGGAGTGHGEFDEPGGRLTGPPPPGHGCRAKDRPGGHGCPVYATGCGVLGESYEP